MEYDIRTALMIISAIAIFAILLHGLWKIRKNKNPYKLKAKSDDVEPLSRNFDGSGFDQDGVGQIRAIKGAALTGEIENPPEEHEIPHQPAPAPEFHAEPIPKDVAEKKEQALAAEPEVTPEQEIQSHEITQAPIVIDEQVPEAEAEQPSAAPFSDNKLEEETQSASAQPSSVYDAPVTNPKPVTEKAVVKPKRKTVKKNTNQMGFNFGDDLTFEDEDEPTLSAQNKAQVEIDPEVIVLSVVMPENQVITGAALLPTLLTLGMKYGDMNIFHRHEDNAGNGKVTFSLANMMNPGTFDLDEIESFATQGVTLFMTLPNPADAFVVFEQMLAAAKHIAVEFKGQLLDDKRSVMTKQTEQHYISKIREFDRKYRIAAS